MRSNAGVGPTYNPMPSALAMSTSRSAVPSRSQTNPPGNRSACSVGHPTRVLPQPDAVVSPPRTRIMDFNQNLNVAVAVEKHVVHTASPPIPWRERLDHAIGGAHVEGSGEYVFPIVGQPEDERHIAHLQDVPHQLDSSSRNSRCRICKRGTLEEGQRAPAIGHDPLLFTCRHREPRAG